MIAALKPRTPCHPIDDSGNSQLINDCILSTAQDFHSPGQTIAVHTQLPQAQTQRLHSTWVSAPSSYVSSSKEHSAGRHIQRNQYKPTCTGFLKQAGYWTTRVCLCWMWCSSSFQCSAVNICFQLISVNFTLHLLLLVRANTLYFCYPRVCWKVHDYSATITLVLPFPLGSNYFVRFYTDGTEGCLIMWLDSFLHLKTSLGYRLNQVISGE